MYNKRFCKEPEKIENYEKALADNFKNWVCHHRLQTWTSDGERRLVDISVEELKALGMYYNRPASELIFLTDEEHGQLHQNGKKRSAETRRKMGEAKKGKHLSEEHKNKIGEAMKGKPGPNKGKKFSEEHKNRLSEAMKGKPGPNKGKKFSEEHKNRLSEAHKGQTPWSKGTRWYNDGKINIMSKECPPGFVPGKLFTNINKGN